MTYYKLLIINGMGAKFLNLSTQMVVERKKKSSTKCYSCIRGYFY